MRLDEMEKDGYALKAWTIANVEGEQRIVLLLEKGNERHVASCLCTDKILKDAEFNEPVVIDQDTIEDDDASYDRAMDEIIERGEYRKGETNIHAALRRARNK